MRVLILIDSITLPHLQRGQPPFAPYSHDRNLFQFAHEALRQGHDVFIASVQDAPDARAYWPVRAVYPLWDQAETPVDYWTVRPDIVTAVFPEALNIRGHFPEAKIVAIHAAIHWLESPEVFSPHYVFDLITAIRYNVDFILTQNERMKDILVKFYGLLARWNEEDRILVAPQGIVAEERRETADRGAARRQMQLADGDIAIINSGGAWRWTDFNTFLDGFGTFMSSAGGPFKLFIMGLHQPENRDHAAYIRETEQILLKHRALVGESIVLETSWEAAGKQVKSFTAGADLGVNVNQDSLENWQSYRLRFLDYMYFGLPVINTRGDYMAERAAEGLYLARAGVRADYETILADIKRRPGALAAKGAAMRALAADYDSRRTYGAAIEQIVRMPRRKEEDIHAWGACVLDFAADRARALG